MADLAELAAVIDRTISRDGIQATPVPRLSLIRVSRPSEPVHVLHEPAFCLIARGAKEVIVGERMYAYGPGEFLVVSVDLPLIGQVVEASPERPYLALRLDLDPIVLGAVMMEAKMHDPPRADSGSGLMLSRLTPELLDAVLRLARLMTSPSDIPILAPLVEREILYRLLCGEQTSRLRQIAMGDSHFRQVTRAIDWIKRNFTQPFSIQTVAEEARMSPSALHEHFKAVTAMSPLQYQKQLRLQEARRLILLQGKEAAAAGFEVGYESPSQFSREYRRLFGAPPKRDISRLRTSSSVLVHT
jgi:AraC-like DNA-binding protein